MTPTHLRKLIGGTAVLTGVLWLVFGAIPAAVDYFSGDFSLDRLLVEILLSAVLIIPGLIFVLSGAKLFRYVDEYSLKWIFSLSAVFVSFWISWKMLPVFTGSQPSDLFQETTVFASYLVLLSLFLSALKVTWRKISGEDRCMSSMLGRGALLYLAFNLYLLLRSFFDGFASDANAEGLIIQQPWRLAGLIVPPIIAIGAYRLSSRFIYIRNLPTNISIADKAFQQNLDSRNNH